MKRTICISLLVAFVITVFTGCFPNTSSMPFNGSIVFHDITLIVPERFVRDSTQSNEDLWIFERGYYKEYIIISRSNIAEDTTAFLDAYAQRMKDVGADSEIVSFNGGEAVLSKYYKDDVFCQEIFFPCGNSYYAIALRGGSEDGFKEVTDTIELMGASQMSI